jgi:signal transduction histidine kinase
VRGATSPESDLGRERSVSDEVGVAATLLEVARTVATELKPHTMLRRLASLALEASGAERAAIFLLDTGMRLVPAVSVSRSRDSGLGKLFLETEPIDVGSHPDRLAAWRDARAFAIDDAGIWGLMPKAWKRLGTKSVAVSPLRVGSESIGLIAVDYASRPHRFTSTDMQILDAIGLSAGIAVRNARFVDELSRRTELQRRLLECTASFRGAAPVQGLSDAIGNGLTKLLEARWVGLFTDANGDRLTLESSWGAAREDRVLHMAGLKLIADHVDVSDSRIGPTVVSDVESKGFVGDLLLVPLAGRPYQAFGVVHRRESFTPEEIEIAEAFAAQAEIAMDEAALRDELSVRASVIEALHWLSKAILGRTDLRAALLKLNKGVLAEMGLECRSVTFSDPTLCADLDVAEPSREEELLLKSWRRLGAFDLGDLNAHGELCVPVRMSGRIAGVLRLKTSRSRPADGQFIQSLADGIGDIAFKAKLRRRAERRTAEVSVARERDRIGRDLHDTLGQLFYGLCLKSQRCLTLDLDEPRARQILIREMEEIGRLSSEGIRDVRAAVYSLAFLQVRAQGFVRALHELSEEFIRSAGIPAQIRVRGSQDSRLPADVESALYRVAHEALVNVDRHARATGVMVELNTQRDFVELIVRDDGVGLDQRQVSHWRSAAHFGVRMMMRSIHELGGTLRVEPAAPRGLMIVARLPLRSTTLRGRGRLA